jgi:hypothetical protein
MQLTLQHRRAGTAWHVHSLAKNDTHTSHIIRKAALDRQLRQATSQMLKLVATYCRFVMMLSLQWFGLVSADQLCEGLSLSSCFELPHTCPVHVVKQPRLVQALGSCTALPGLSGGAVLAPRWFCCFCTMSLLAKCKMID